jgi:hypothetical protein
MVEGGEAHADQVGTGLVLLEGSATGGSERVPTGQDSAVDDATPARGPEIGHTAHMSVRRLVLGGTLLALGVLVGVVGLVLAFRSFFDIEAAVPLDGEPHVVDVGAGEHFVWVDSSTTEPTCAVESGSRPVPLDPVTGSFTRSSGSSGPWEARWVFDAPGPRVEVTCTAVGASDSDAVEVGPRIEGLGFVGRLLLTVALAAVLVLAGGILLLVTVVRGLAAPSAPSSPPPFPQA